MQFFLKLDGNWKYGKSGCHLSWYILRELKKCCYLYHMTANFMGKIGLFDFKVSKPEKWDFLVFVSKVIMIMNAIKQK